MPTNPSTDQPRRRPLRLSALALSSAAAIGLLAGVNFGHPGVAATAAPVTPSAQAPWAGYADLIEQVMPSVVAITAKRDLGNEAVASPGQPRWREFGEGPDSEMMRRFMERFFGEQMPFDMPMPPRGGPEFAPTAMG
jgi:hypothetical protein